MGGQTMFHSQYEETMSRDELRALQTARLWATVRRVYDHNSYQRERFKQRGVHPDDLHDLKDLAKLPTMSKEDFRLNYPLGLSCVDKRDVIEMHMSSGLTGTPVVMPYTHSDLLQWAECVARCLRMAGAEPADVIQITPSFGLFNGGFGFYHGAETLKLFVLPTGSGNTHRQVQLAKDFNTRILTGVVSYGVRMMEVLEETGGTLPDLEIGIFGAEMFSDAMKRKLSEALGIEVFDIYGMTESGGVGTLGMDCPAHDGLHVWEDHYLVEILDPATGMPVEDGEVGELTITALTREALPVVRFRTADLTKVVSRAPCACGRSHLRIAPILGRSDDMLIAKGVCFFPSQVEQALLQVPGVGSNYQIIVEEHDGIQSIRVNIEADSSSETKIRAAGCLREALGFMPKLTVSPLGSLPRSEGKVKRVLRDDGTGAPA